MDPQGSDAGLVQQYLRDRTIGCPDCKYNLRGAAGQQCPECGTPLALHLTAHNMRLGWWLIGMLAVALPLGFAVVLTATGAVGAWRSAFWSEQDWWLFGALCLLTLFYSIGLVSIIRRRPRFMQRSLIEQRVRAGGLAVVMISLQVLWLYLFARYRPYW